MKYLLLIYYALSQTEREQRCDESAQLTPKPNSSGRHPAAAPVHAASAVTRPRVRIDKRLLTDGPFIETYEQLGG